MDADTDKLYERALETTVRSARATLDLRARLQATPFEAVGERIASFRSSAAPLDVADDVTGGFHVRSADAKAFLATLEMHPAYSSGAKLDVGIPVIGQDLPGDDRQGAEAAELLLLGGLALSQEGANEQHLDALMQIVLSADPLSGLLRDVMLGKPFNGDGNPFDIPKDLLDLADRLDQRSCGLGLSHALSDWGRELANSRSTAWSTGITSLVPNVGCGGEIVIINGSGFGATQPPDVGVWFPRIDGGCVVATVMSWSDTAIVTQAPATVGVGCVGFVRVASGGGSLAEAASTLAGEMVRCVGLPAYNAAGRIEKLGRHPLLECPPCLPGGVNRFTGGRPRILRFAANGVGDVEIQPSQDLILDWDVANATSVDIVPILHPTQPNENTPPYGPYNPQSGTFTFLAFNGSFTWDREYELRAWNGCTPPDAPVTARVMVRMRSKADLKIYGIEVTQSIQFFDASRHMLNAQQWLPDNSVPLIALKPTVARVFVDSGQKGGFDGGLVTGVSGKLFGFDQAGNRLPGSPLDPLGPTFTPNASVRVTAEPRPASAGQVAARRLLPPVSAFLYLLPAAWTAAGEIKIRATVSMPAGTPETSTTNNARQQRVIFNPGGLPIRLAVLPIAYADPGTGIMIPAPNATQIIAESDQLQRALPSHRGLLSVVLAPGGANPWTYGGNLSASGISCGKGFNEILIELATRAFFTIGLEDRVWVGMLDRAGLTASVPAGGCGTPMGSMGLAWLGGGALAGLLLGPFAPIVAARLGTCALGVAGALIGAPRVPPVGGGSGTVLGTLAQEVGHGLGLFHVPDGVAPPPTENNWPDYELGSPPGSIGEFGLEIDDLRLPPVLKTYQPRSFLPTFPGSSTDFMGYFGSNDWVSPFMYQRVMSGGFVASPAGPSPGQPLTAASAIVSHVHGEALDTLGEVEEHDHHHHGEITSLEGLDAVEPGEVVFVRGAVLKQGVMLFPAFVQTKPIRFAEQHDSPYRLVVLNRDGKELAGNAIMPVAEQHTGTPRPDFLFATALPWSEDASRIEVQFEGEVLASIDVAEKAPVLSEPEVVVKDEVVTMRWKVEHPDIASARYLVRFARDENRQWQFLEGDLVRPELRIRADSLPSADQGIFQIGASVGGRTTWVESAPVKIAGGLPQLAILSPRDGEMIHLGDETQLRVALLSTELDLPIEKATAWRSSIDGDLARGAEGTVRLSEGKHELSVTFARDGRSVTASAVVYVDEKPDRVNHRDPS